MSNKIAVMPNRFHTFQCFFYGDVPRLILAATMVKLHTFRIVYKNSELFGYDRRACTNVCIENLPLYESNKYQFCSDDITSDVKLVKNKLFNNFLIMTKSTLWARKPTAHVACSCLNAKSLLSK